MTPPLASPPPVLRWACVLPWLLPWWPLAAADLHQRDVPRNPSSAKECAICHYRWVDTFFMDGRGTDLVPLQREQVEGTSAMCFSCHDGSVLDSRWAFEKERGHGAGMAPPAGMILPNTFPLDAQGHLQCVTCHSAHGVSSVSGESTSTFLRVINTNSSICLLCHPTMGGTRAGNNHPLGLVTNTIPRELWNKHSAPETAAHLITCETCHTPHANQQEYLLKQTVSDSTLCLTCHTDKNPVNQDGTRNFFHVLNVIPTNAVVPATLLTNGARLAKSGALTCSTCHKVHQNQIEQHLLVAKNDNQSSFCLNCHPNQQGVIRSTHNLARKFPDAPNLAGKTVRDSGPCSACHLPHQNARILAGGADATAGLCLSCHGPAGLAANTNLFGRSHPVGVPIPTARASPAATQPVTLPLFDSSRRPVARGNVTCMTCHDPHRVPREGSPLTSAKFLRSDVFSLCQECHAAQASVRRTKHDLSTAAPAIANVAGQTPTDAGSCSACHLLHSANPSTWARPWLPSPDPADKCRSCHRPGGPAEKKTIQYHSHPIDVSPQQTGLQTILPLYVESTQTNAPGKMTCLTCHDPHRANPLIPLAAGPPGAGSARNLLPTVSPAIALPPALPWSESNAPNRFLRLPISPVPTLCINCHVQEARVLGTEHDLSVFFPANANLLGQRAADSGPCGACHLSHHAPLQSKLWARELRQSSPNTPLVEAMCRSCHSPGAVAAGKVPLFTYHPPVTVVHLPAADGYDRAFFPLFDPVSGKQVNAGAMACSSCHNVHQWSIRGPEPLPGWNLDGDSDNSFLRHRSAELPCKICHGLDAIYRYQYYHKSSTHQWPDDFGLDELLR